MTAIILILSVPYNVDLEGSEVEWRFKNAQAIRLRKLAHYIRR